MRIHLEIRDGNGVAGIGGGEKVGIRVVYIALL